MCNFVLRKKLFSFCLFICFLLILIHKSVFKARCLEITDTDKNLTEKFDLFIGTFINKTFVVGLTNESCAITFSFGYNPVKDSSNISKFQIFLKYYLQENTFFQ